MPWGVWEDREGERERGRGGEGRGGKRERGREGERERGRERGEKKFVASYAANYFHVLAKNNSNV